MLSNMYSKIEPTYSCRVYLSGPIEIAKQLLREECLREGLCVTVDPTIFLYTGGEEQGYVIGFLNYPRFPADHHSIFKRARKICLLLLEKTYQLSGLIVSQSHTEWVFLDAKKD